MNQEHVNVLRAGVTAWNAWRRNNPEIIAILSRAYLSHADLSGAYLSRADLSRADLSRAKGILSLGQDSRGFEWYAVQHTDGPRIKAGCRWFTLPEAHAYWENPNYRPSGLPLGAANVSAIRAECLARLAFAETLAAIHGWIAKTEKEEIC